MSSLLVASSGGHLAELHRLAPRLPPRLAPTVWVTNDSMQSRSLLHGEAVVFVPYQGSRNMSATAANALRAARILKRYSPASVVSTGSGIALAFLPLATALGATCHYIESGTRVRSPSVTGALLSRLPGIRCYTQHPERTARNWNFGGSVFEGFQVAPVAAPPASIRRAAVMLGTWRQPFRRLVEHLLTILPPGVDTVWQTGFTDVSDLPIEAQPWLSPQQLSSAMSRADVVVTHAGMGTVLDALDAGRLPIIVPRRACFNEQVDDHQVELATALAARGLALARQPEEITNEQLLQAAAYGVTQPRPLPPFALLPHRTG